MHDFVPARTSLYYSPHAAAASSSDPMTPLLRAAIGPLCGLIVALPWTAARADWDAAMIARAHGDFALAYGELKAEADAGAADAQAVVGEMLARGQGVPKNEQAAAEMFRRAAANGSVPGMLEYGTAALRGAGMPGDAAAGLQWITRAAMAGYPAAMLLLGDCHQNGIGG